MLRASLADRADWVGSGHDETDVDGVVENGAGLDEGRREGQEQGDNDRRGDEFRAEELSAVAAEEYGARCCDLSSATADPRGKGGDRQQRESSAVESLGSWRSARPRDDDGGAWMEATVVQVGPKRGYAGVVVRKSMLIAEKQF